VGSTPGGVHMQSACGAVTTFAQTTPESSESDVLVVRCELAQRWDKTRPQLTLQSAFGAIFRALVIVYSTWWNVCLRSVGDEGNEPCV
jgi:hypothetical protein